MSSAQPLNSDPSSDPILRVSDIHLRFGGIIALDGVSFDINADEICGLIGPNGAGKTTLFNCVSRIYTPQSGKIHFQGVNLLERHRNEIAALGIARTFQNVGVYSALSVIDNVKIGAHSSVRAGFFSAALNLPSVGAEEKVLTSRAEALLDLLSLAEHRDKLPSELPFGTLKRLELARALIARPKILMLDEPANGLSHSEVSELGELISSVKTQLGLSVLVVEHHMGLVSSICQRVVVIDLGRKIAEGTPGEIARNPEVIAAYLGRTE